MRLLRFAGGLLMGGTKKFGAGLANILITEIGEFILTEDGFEIETES